MHEAGANTPLGYYTTPQIMQLLKLTRAQLKALLRMGFLTLEFSSSRRRLFSFQDLVLLRTAHSLHKAKIPSAKIKRALKRLQLQLPTGRPLTAVTITGDSQGVVASDGNLRWRPDSGQILFDFKVADLAKKVAPITQKRAALVKQNAPSLDAEKWFDLGAELELSFPHQARHAYRHAVELDPGHAAAHTNLGRLLHEAKDYRAAENHYKMALVANQSFTVAWFNLAVLFEDCMRFTEAIFAYRKVIALDANYADAHYNLGHIYEQQKKPILALRHLRVYDRLMNHR